MRKTGSLDGWRGTVALAVALFAAQAALWINPGYFSHDELQWGARAAVGSGRSLPFLSFTDWHTFQFRPLTFNLWLLLSQSLFDSPRLFHALFAALGAANALLLVKVLRAAGCRRAVAFGAALAFTFSPSAAWVHGWVGCLADLLWVGLGLALVVFLQHCAAAETRDSDARSTPGPAGTWAIAAVAALLTALALLSKEAALSIPALLGLAAVLLRPPRVWRLAAFASGAVAVLYLALRLETLTAPDAASSYAVQFGALPLRLGEYALFPWALGMQEVAAMARADPAKWLRLALAPLAVALCLWRAGPRFLLAGAAGSVLALGPVLVLPTSANQYGYGLAALACGVAALAWSRLGRAGKLTLALLALVAAVHGLQIQNRMLEIGRLQSVFSPSLAAQAQAQPQGPIRLWPVREDHAYAYARLSHEVPSWRGVALGARVSLAERAEQATHRIAPDGRVHPIQALP